MVVMASNTSTAVRLLLVAATAIMYLLVAAAPPTDATITCGQVAGAVGPCLSYIRGMGPLVGGCCSGVRGLNSVAKTTPDRQQACTCLKTLSGNIPGLDPRLAASLPASCGVSIPYPISTTTDCSKVR